MPSNPFELAVALFFQSSADEIKSFEQPFEALILSSSDDLQLLMKTASGDLAFDEVLLMTSALQEHFVFRTSFL